MNVVEVKVCIYWVGRLVMAEGVLGVNFTRGTRHEYGGGC